MNFTTINHDARIKLGLSLTEYCLIDLVYNLSNSPTSRNEFDGWCFASRSQLAQYLGLTKRGIYKLIAKLEGMGFLIKHEATNHLRAKDAWYNTVLIKSNSEQSSPLIVNKVHHASEQSSPPPSEQSSPYKDNIYKDTYIPVTSLQGKATQYGNPDINQVVGEFETLIGKMPRATHQRRAAQTLISRHGIGRVIKAIRFVAEARGTPYMPRVASLEDLRDKWVALEDFAIQTYRQHKPQGRVIR